MATVKTKLNIETEALKQIKLVAVAYSYVEREFFPTEEAYIAEQEVEGRAQEIIAEIHNVVLNDRRVKVRELANIAKISIDRLNKILHEHLHMKKLSARWVPRLLTVDQRRIRMNVS